MHKEQLMELHQFFVHVHRELLPSEDQCKYFKIYDDLDVRPHHIHKLKNEQIAAIFLLSACITEHLSKNGGEDYKKLSFKLVDKAFKYINPKSKNMSIHIEEHLKHNNSKNNYYGIKL